MSAYKYVLLEPGMRIEENDEIYSEKRDRWIKCSSSIGTIYRGGQWRCAGLVKRAMPDDINEFQRGYNAGVQSNQAQVNAMREILLDIANVTTSPNIRDYLKKKLEEDHNLS